MEPNHLNLLCDVNELSALLAGRVDISTFLQRTVVMVARHLRADVCSIYLLDESRGELVLRATQGLNQTQVGQLRLGADEGLVGLCWQQRQPRREAKASGHPRYRHVPGLDEEGFDAFLAVPIQRGTDGIGVLVVQRREQQDFSADDILALQGTAAQLAGAVQNARVLQALQAPAAPAAATGMRLVAGQVAAKGFALAPALVYSDRRDTLLEPVAESRAYTLAEFRAALQATEQQLEAVETRLGQQLPEMASMIFGAHRMILCDPQFAGAMEERMAAGSEAAAAVRHVARHFEDVLRGNPNEYIREKAADVRDLAARLLANLTQPGAAAGGFSAQHKIVIARELYPSEVLRLSSEGADGVVLATGGVTSHVAILARSLRLPLVIADSQDLLHLPADTRLLLDGETGNVYVNPTTQVVGEFARRNRNRASTAQVRLQPITRLRSGERIRLLANVNLLSELATVRELAAEGIGLYRTEFPFMIRSDFPTEAEQVSIYHRLIEGADGKEVTFRTLDIGGDKVLSYFPEHQNEDNPALGMRAIRFSFRHQDLFREQLRAILRAGYGHPHLRVMFPMIGGVDEFRAARAVFAACVAELRAAAVPFQDDLQVGLMVEVPSVVEVMDELAPLADFFCIGTNDFTQYLLAVDRNNEKVSSYFLPHHPAVLRALARLVPAVRRHGKDLAVCGEMAHEPAYVPFLLGLGIDRLSIDAQYLPKVQHLINRLTLTECQALAAAVLRECDAKRILEQLRAVADRASAG